MANTLQETERLGFKLQDVQPDSIHDLFTLLADLRFHSTRTGSTIRKEKETWILFGLTF